MELNKEIVENLLTMLNSEDKENAYIAMKAIEQYDFTGKNYGYLIYIYKFSKHGIDVWKTQSPAIASTLEKEFYQKPLSFSDGLNIMISKKLSKDALELFMERHVKDLVKMLGDMGYPTDKLEFNLQLKNE